jgi:serine protease Do
MEAEQHGTTERRGRSLSITGTWLLVIGLGIVGFLSAYQYRQIRRLQSQHQQEIRDRSQSKHQLVNDLRKLNRDLARRLEEVRRVAGRDSQTNELLWQRLTALDERVNSSARRMDGMLRDYTSAEEALASQSGGVCLVEGEYEFYEPSSGKALRFVDADGGGESGSAEEKDILPVSTEGRGRTFSVHYTGTGFLVDARGYILTNHHVVTPWETTKAYKQILDGGYEARMTLLRVFFPNQVNPFAVQTVATGYQEDVALIWADLEGEDIPVLTCESGPDESLKPGQRVIVLGYPTGFDLMLARLGRDQLYAVLGDGQFSYEQIARNLAVRGLIQPSATGGLCSRVGGGRIVYDAQTAIGGSGAPVLGVNGRVVAINTALLKSFSGSNFGIPIRYGLELLERYAGKTNPQTQK